MSIIYDVAKGTSHCVSHLQKLDINSTLSARGIHIRKVFAPLLRLVYATQTKYRIIIDSRVELPQSSKGRIFVINHRQADDIVIGANAVGVKVVTLSSVIPIWHLKLPTA